MGGGYRNTRAHGAGGVRTYLHPCFAKSMLTQHTLVSHVQAGQRKGMLKFSCRPKAIYVLGSFFLTGKSAVSTTSVLTPFDGPPMCGRPRFLLLSTMIPP